MGKKTNLKTPSPHPSLLPGSTSLPIFSPSSPQVAQGDREWGLWSVHHILSLPIHPPQWEDSSHSALAPMWGSSRGRQFSTNCFSVGPFHGVQSFRNRLFQSGSPTGPEVLPGARSSMGLPQSHSLLRASTCSGMGSLLGCRWISAPPWTSMGCRGTACLTMVCSMCCRGISALVPGARPPSPSSLTLVSAMLFLSHILTPFPS